MWDLNTRWFDVAVVLGIFAFGSILFGIFEQHKPRLRRVLKVVVFLGLTILIAETAGRPWAYGFLALPLIAALYLHAVWLPKHGINGWTAQPYDKYLALLESRGFKKGAS